MATNFSINASSYVVAAKAGGISDERKALIEGYKNYAAEKVDTGKKDGLISGGEINQLMGANWCENNVSLTTQKFAEILADDDMRRNGNPDGVMSYNTKGFGKMMNYRFGPVNVSKENFVGQQMSHENLQLVGSRTGVVSTDVGATYHGDKNSADEVSGINSVAGVEVGDKGVQGAHASTTLYKVVGNDYGDNTHVISGGAHLRANTPESVANEKGQTIISPGLHAGYTFLNGARDNVPASVTLNVGGEANYHSEGKTVRGNSVSSKIYAGGMGNIYTSKNNRTAVGWDVSGKLTFNDPNAKKPLTGANLPTPEGTMGLHGQHTIMTKTVNGKKVPVATVGAYGGVHLSAITGATPRVGVSVVADINN